MYQMNEIDHKFISKILDELTLFFPETFKVVFDHSSFLRRLEEDPDYVYHYPPKYWAEIIRDEYYYKQMQPV